MPPPIPLQRDLQIVLQRVVGHDLCALLLDYDGTLTPIVPDPAEAELSPAMRGALTSLLRHPRYRVGIVSGRALSDLRARINSKPPYLAGNHGLEIEAPGTIYSHPEAQRLRPQLQALARSLQQELEQIPGALVEDKGLSLSVHFRRVPEALVPVVKGRLLQLARSAIDAGTLALRTGKDVLELRPRVTKAVSELRPRVTWDKGDAVRWIVEHIRQEVPAASILPVYIGDDDTDENAFRALASTGVGIVVGADRLQSAAHYYVPSVEETAHFLELLSGLP